MNYFAFLAPLLIPLGLLAQPNSSLNSLEQLTWQNRVILVFSDRRDHFENIFDNAKAQVNDRDIVWFIINNKAVTSNYPGEITDAFVHRTHRRFYKGGEQIILIGKDGGVKEQGDALTIKELFDDIDAMPMRIREMQEKTGKRPD